MSKAIKKHVFDARHFMQLAIEEMKKSVAENRDDGKASPKVGAVLVSPLGEVLGTAHRGELREGDHAEYTLLDRKFRDKNVTGNYLFATLEPCAPGSRKHPKLGCAERIVNARIAKIWIGVEDPDPTVDRKGIKYLMDAGIEVEMFDNDLQEEILTENKNFLEQAKQRAEEEKKPKEVVLTPLEKLVAAADLIELSDNALSFYIQRAGLNMSVNSPEFHEHLLQKQLIERDGNGNLKPTGLGILLFGNNPRDRYPQAVLKVQARYGNAEPEIQDFADALVLLPDQVENWLKKVLSSKISREGFTRETVYDYPMEILAEAINNAIVHRDYDIEGAKIYVNIEDEKIVVKSPGLPIKPIKFEDFQQFKAPSLSRNPKIMAVFNAMNYVEERGLGMHRMKSLPESYKLPRPSVTWEDPYLTITFPRSKAFIQTIVQGDVLSELNDEEKKGLLFIRDRRIVSKPDYAHNFYYNEKKAQRHLSKFVELGLVTAIGQGPSRRFHYVEQ
jgi:ATP-dependent DNA helicase RecG